MNPFEVYADEYDQWFDSLDGQSIFQDELSCLRGLIPEVKGRWLEIGVGTGRFAEAFGIPEGVDPSEAVLKLAENRAVRTCRARAEALPFQDHTFDGLLMVMTICFLSDPQQALSECFRVLKDDGCLITGFVPADSLWGRLYTQKARQGHRFYCVASFYTCDQIVDLAAQAGFVLETAQSCLFIPSGRLKPDSSSQEKAAADPGFVALKLFKTPCQANA